jgi:hypothetical protein
MHRALFLFSALAAVLIAGCERAKAPPVTNLTATPAAGASSPGGVVAATNAAKPWDDALGAVVATPSLDGGAAVSFMRDTAGTADLAVELLGRDVGVVKATLHPGTTIGSCAWRRSASLKLADGRAAPDSWSLALSPGIATPLGIDGVDDLPPRDSAATVARISRLVSALPDDSASAPYRGLPVVVRDAWRVKLADSATFAVAIAMRSLNVESDPRAQAITLIAEPDPSAGAGQWRTVFSERVAGAEDRVEGTDLLAAFLVRGAAPAVALLREGSAGVQVEIVERTAPAVWTVRWSSAVLPCARP